MRDYKNRVEEKDGKQMNIILSTEQEQALINRFIFLIQSHKMPLAMELKNTLTAIGVHIKDIHEASAVDFYRYRQCAIRNNT